MGLAEASKCMDSGMGRCWTCNFRFHGELWGVGQEITWGIIGHVEVLEMNPGILEYKKRRAKRNRTDCLLSCRCSYSMANVI